MNRINGTNSRYATVADLLESRVEIVVYPDPEGSRLNTLFRKLTQNAKDDESTLHAKLTESTKALCWLRITQPQPLQFNGDLVEAAHAVWTDAVLTKQTVPETAFIEQIVSASLSLTTSAAETSSRNHILESCEEVGPAECAVVAAGRKAQRGLQSWLRERGISVLTEGELMRSNKCFEQIYVVGPPKFYSASLVTASVSQGVTFFVPNWFRELSLQESVLSEFAEGAIRMTSKVFREHEQEELDPIYEDDLAGDVDLYTPTPVWPTSGKVTRDLQSKQACARRVYLAGGYAMWLDDGTRIRTLDPRQPQGKRISYEEVPNIREGSFLLLRRGATERETLDPMIRLQMGSAAEQVFRCQSLWKEALTNRLQQHGYHRVARDLTSLGVKAVDQVESWSHGDMIRPRSDSDFKLLLGWLDIPIQPTFKSANLMRTAHYRASAQIRAELEQVALKVDLTALESSGFMDFELDGEGYRGIFAAQVLAISPEYYAVPRSSFRIPTEDSAGKWLE